ncbi:MAG TPA: MBOAT family O-acyltransferase [Bryobacteraceae bacterium]|nr:MBOAT family O-acyltransferase [Bryobacteraceae bacterium]
MHSATGSFYVLVAAVFFLYWACAGVRVLRLGIILAANYLFCAHFGLFYVVLLPVCGTVDYLLGLGLMRFERSWLRRVLVGASVVMNLGLLVGGRHMGWFLGSRWDWIFPLGLSFYAFQSLTYTIDLYRRDGEGTKSLLTYLSAAAFFPTLEAGPITRVSEIVKQLAARPSLRREDGGRAFFLIGMGILKKALIADFLAENLVNRVFDTPTLYSGAETLIAVYAFSLQLYFDFSGYTDIARGAALLLGVRLPLNFDRPYQSQNLPEFWRRWHITFSNWLRDYLFFSLPGKRSAVMPYLNLVITMTLGGLWHGLGWTFFVWGLLHGLGLAVTRAWQARKRGAATARGRGKTSPLAVFATYQFVCLTWIFFRASSLSNALEILARIGSLTVGFENIAPTLALVMLIGVAAMLARKQWYEAAMERFAACPFYIHAAAITAVALTVHRLGGRGNVPFVYSRF